MSFVLNNGAQNPIQNKNSLTPNTIQNFCKKYNPSASVFSSFTPIIYSLSVITSKKGFYTVVYVNGLNFVPNNTYIKFGSLEKLPVTFFTSSVISFVVPSKANIGTYIVSAISIYTDNFSPSINSSYPGSFNYSNSVYFEIT